MDVSEIHEALENCLLDNYPQQVVCKLNFKNLKNHVLSQNVSLKFRLSALVEEGLKNKVVETVLDRSLMKFVVWILMI